MSRASLRVVVLLAMLPCVAPTGAHGQARRPVTSSNPSKIGFRGFGDAGLTVLTAADSFKAILGKPSGPLFGGGVELGLPRHLFVTVSANRFRRTGHRVFVFQGQVFPLNVPTTIALTPLEFTAGYRFLRFARLIPYGGAGAGAHKYDETSAHSTDADDVHKTFAGYHVLGGAEFPLGKRLGVAGEAQWTSVPNALGKESTSVSSAFHEHDLGGFTLKVKVVIGR